MDWQTIKLQLCFFAPMQLIPSVGHAVITSFTQLSKKYPAEEDGP
jgi:hypothetical protein